MNKEERNKILEDFAGTAPAQALADYLEELKQRLDTVMEITSIEETLGRQRALQIINNLIKVITRQDPKHNKPIQYT
jgi:hypothetical protein